MSVDPQDPVVQAVTRAVKTDLRKNKKVYGIPGDWDADEVGVVAEAAVASTINAITNPTINLL